MKANRYFITSSIGVGITGLTSFDNALMDSTLGNYNLVKVNSILPAKALRAMQVGCTEGNVLFTAFAHITPNKTVNILTASVAVGIPKNDSNVGVIMELACNEKIGKAEENITEMVKEAMSNRDIEIADILVKSSSIEADGSGKYFTAFAAISMWEE